MVWGAGRRSLLDDRDVNADMFCVRMDKSALYSGNPVVISREECVDKKGSELLQVLNWTRCHVGGRRRRGIRAAEGA